METTRPKRFFNVAGPCDPTKHYTLPAQRRQGHLCEFVDGEQYFVIHAARQSGKTTLLLDLARELNESRQYRALYCSVETAQGIVDPREGIPAITRTLVRQVRYHPSFKDYADFADGLDPADFNNLLHGALTELCVALDKPLIMLFDEVDCLANGTLISFLRQLRDGYVNRQTAPFVHSLALVGMCDIRDYRARVRGDRETLGSSSPFNIVTESLTLRNFTRDEVGELYGQHTADTGQVFAEEAVDRAFYWSNGQPWLANALAREMLKKHSADPTERLRAAMVDDAAEELIMRRDTHIDSLLERLKEARVRAIMEPVMLGEGEELERLADDFQYVLDLGLIQVERGKVAPGNRIYAEVIGRTLSYDMQQNLLATETGSDAPFYVRDGRLDMSALLREFQGFWRENSEVWLERFDYKEAGPHLVLMAFLQRVLNGGGRIVREMATGTRRLDLCVEYEGGRYPIEIKLRRSGKTEQQGIEQLSTYLDTLGCDEGHLVIFDRRPGIPWEERLGWKTLTHATHTIHVVTC